LTRFTVHDDTQRVPAALACVQGLENETKRNETERNETEKTVNFQKRNETERKKFTKSRNETKRNGKPQETKRNVTILFRNEKNET
jgi:hypothetical protein